MRRQCEYKKKYSPTLGKHVRQHVYGEGVYDVITGLSRKLFGKTTKDIANKVAKKAATTAIDKTGTFVGNKAGDKIVKILQGKNRGKYKYSPQGITSIAIPKGDDVNPPSKLTTAEKNARIQRLLMAGAGRKKR